MKKTPAEKYLASVRRKPAKSEHCLQRAIVRWCRCIGAGVVRERFAAIPNGWGVRSATARDRMIQGARLKAEGARAGMPDLVFWGPGGEVLWLEVKLGTGGIVSPSQKVIHAALSADGHRIEVVRNLADALTTILTFYRNPAPPNL